MNIIILNTEQIRLIPTPDYGGYMVIKYAVMGVTHEVKTRVESGKQDYLLPITEWDGITPFDVMKVADIIITPDPQ